MLYEVITEEVALLEKQRIREALTEHRYNRRKAATRLGLSYDQFRGLLRKYGEEVSGDA